VHCYALNARDSSPARAAVERESVNMCEGKINRMGRGESEERGGRGGAGAGTGTR